MCVSVYIDGATQEKRGEREGRRERGREIGRKLQKVPPLPHKRKKGREGGKIRKRGREGGREEERKPPPPIEKRI